MSYDVCEEQKEMKVIIHYPQISFAFTGVSIPFGHFWPRGLVEKHTLNNTVIVICLYVQLYVQLCIVFNSILFFCENDGHKNVSVNFNTFFFFTGQEILFMCHILESLLMVQ